MIAEEERVPFQFIGASQQTHSSKAYAARCTGEGKTKKEIIRCLKRYIAREIYKAPCQRQQPGRSPASHAKQDLSAPTLT